MAKLATSLIPEHLLAALLGIEQRLGRVRDGKRWGPRTLDLDLLVYDQLSVDTPNLVVPHPRMHERAFVLVPLNDLSPQLEVPGLGQVGNLLAALDDKERSGVRRASPLDESPATSIRAGVMSEAKSVTVPALARLKAEKQPITMLTAYDASFGPAGGSGRRGLCAGRRLAGKCDPGARQHLAGQRGSHGLPRWGGAPRLEQGIAAG